MQKGDRLNDREWLLRRGWYPSNKHIRRDKTIAATAFQPRHGDDLQLSVNLERLTELAWFIQDPARFRICRIQAETVHKFGLTCVYDPISPSENDPAGNAGHALICGFEPDDLVVPELLARHAMFVDYP